MSESSGGLPQVLSDSPESSDSSYFDADGADEANFDATAVVTFDEPAPDATVDFNELRTKHPLLRFPLALSGANFSHNALFKELCVSASEAFWVVSLPDAAASALRSTGALAAESLDITRVSAVFAGRFRTTARLLLGVVAGLPVISAEYLLDAGVVRQLRRGLGAAGASAWLLEPSAAELQNLGPGFADAVARLMPGGYSLGAVCRRHARCRLVLGLRVVVTEEGVLGRQAGSEDDFYALAAFSLLLLQLGVEILIVTHSAVDLKHQRELMAGKCSLRKYIREFDPQDTGAAGDGAGVENENGA